MNFDRITKLRITSFLLDAKTWLPIAVFVLLILGIELWDLRKFTDSVIEEKEMVGQLIGLHQNQTDTGNWPVFSVRLSGNKTVLVAPGTGTSYKPGNLVRVIERSSKLGRTSYGFAGYMENPNPGK